MRNYDTRPTPREAELDQIRKEQAQVGKRMTLGVKDENRRSPARVSSEGTPRRIDKSVPSRKEFVSKGHDTILEGIQKRRGLIKVYMNSGRTYRGTMVARDKFTITVATTDNPALPDKEVTLYKSSIEGFTAET